MDGLGITKLGQFLGIRAGAQDVNSTSFSWSLAKCRAREALLALKRSNVIRSTGIRGMGGIKHLLTFVFKSSANELMLALDPTFLV